MRFRPSTKETVVADLEGLVTWLKDPNVSKYCVDDALVDQVNAMIDCFLHDDAFGTEGQNDPRGDHRN